MILVDVHAHVDMLKDIDGAIENAKNAGVKTIITNGVNAENNRLVLELAEKYDIVQAALGMYPIDAEKLSEEELDKEIEFISKNKEKIVGLGEVGLDYKHVTDKKQQKLVFQRFIALSEKIKKPLIVHTRLAEADVVNMLESSHAKVDLHCFEGSLKLVRKAADLGYYFSIPTNIVRSEHFQNLVREVDINQLLTETDSPFLAPVKEQQNEPAFVVESVKKIAEVKEMEIEEVANNVWMNYQQVL